jgi:hypothetical protein
MLACTGCVQGAATCMGRCLKLPRIPAFTLNLTHCGRRNAPHTHLAVAAAVVERPGGLPVFYHEPLVTPHKATCWALHAAGAACCSVM